MGVGENCSEMISGGTLSAAWAKALIKSYEAPGGILFPASIRFSASNGADGLEMPEVRRLVDEMLENPKKYIPGESVVETVAGTIFPETLWLRSGGDRNTFYRKYESMLERIKKKQANRRGIYFQRLIAYRGDEQGALNQLEFIINTWRAGNHRNSALQAGIFDPMLDHSNAHQLGFPCLQQIVFHPMGSNGCKGLSIVAFYATQTLIEKAYGNYLGLYRLGKFMADAMGLELKEIMCSASVLKMSDKKGKGECSAMIKDLRRVLADAGEL